MFEYMNFENLKWNEISNEISKSLIFNSVNESQFELHDSIIGLS